MSNGFFVGTKFSNGGVARICGSCYHPFLQFDRANTQMQQNCPTCTDIEQVRPSIVQERRVLNMIYGVTVQSLPPGEWQHFTAQPGDEPRWRLSVKGSHFGADWSGRIEIWSGFDRPVQIGDVVRIRHMEALHTVKAVYQERQTLHHGTVTVRSTTPITGESYSEIDIETDRHEYIVIEPDTTGKKPSKKLEWVEARSEVTLKGLGRQYASQIVGDPIWSMPVVGSSRSGRIRTEAMLAVTDDEHWVMAYDIDAEEFRAGVLANLQANEFLGTQTLEKLMA